MKYLLLPLLLFISFSLFGQKSYNPKDFSSKPIWMEMMNDSNVNYFLAEIAYNSFWKNKEKPLNEDENIGESGLQNRLIHGNLFQKIKAKRELKKKREMHNKYFLECKRFEHWLFINKPYVQEDGSILSDSDRHKIYLQQRQTSPSK